MNSIEERLILILITLRGSFNLQILYSIIAKFYLRFPSKIGFKTPNPNNCAVQVGRLYE